MCDLLPPKLVTVVAGRAEVLQTFQLTGKRRAAVAGCKVISGTLTRKDTFRVLRGGVSIFEGPPCPSASFALPVPFIPFFRTAPQCLPSYC